MNFVPGNTHHVYNQGNNKQQLFYSTEDYLTFLRLIRRLIVPYAEVIAYCLMPNHFHIMLVADERSANLRKQGGLMIDPITNGFRKLLSNYSRITNTKNNTTGSLFRQKTKAKDLAETKTQNVNDYYLACLNYIHQNPVKAGLANHPADWEYSSYRDYAGLRNGTLCNKILGMQYCGVSGRDFNFGQTGDGQTDSITV